MDGIWLNEKQTIAGKTARREKMRNKRKRNSV